MNGTLSEFLNLLDLRGQTWCLVDVRSSGGFSIPVNECVLFYAVLEGSARISGLGGETIALRSGQVAMILSGEPHAVRTNLEGVVKPLEVLCEDHDVDVPPNIVVGKGGSIGARLLCARLKVSWPQGLRRVSMPPFVTLGTDQSNFSSFSGIRAETLRITATGAGSAAMLTRLAALMLTATLRAHPQCLLLFRSSTWSDPIAHALHLIGTDPAADWSIAKLARKVGMGRSSFAARFTEQVGRTPMDVITERRMQQAVELLQQSEMKLVEISARVGYCSEAAFSRRFTRHFGVSPGRVRRSAQQHRDKDSAMPALDSILAGPASPS